MKIDTDLKQEGIWQYHKYLSPVSPEFRLSLGEGNTKEDYCNALDVTLKREDQNPTGSLKDRGMAYLISKALSLGEKKFVLSSSGNAAISAVKYAQKAGLALKVFVSPRVDKGKLEILKKAQADVLIEERPLTMAARFAKENSFYNLRPSINEFGHEGYKTLAFEIYQNIPDVSDIFIPVSSGVNFLGIYEGFNQIGGLPRFHLCQSSFIHPMAVNFDTKFQTEEKSLASSLVAKRSPLGDEIVKAVKISGGTGWIIENSQINEAQKILVKEGITTSNEGALALAAVTKAKRADWHLKKTVVLLTGKKYISN